VQSSARRAESNKEVDPTGRGIRNTGTKGSGKKDRAFSGGTRVGGEVEALKRRRGNIDFKVDAGSISDMRNHAGNLGGGKRPSNRL